VTTIVGVAGLRRNGSVAVVSNGEPVLACEYERLSRIRDVALPENPREAVDAVLHACGFSASAAHRFAVGEAGIQDYTSLAATRVDHAEAHAAAAFLNSPFDEAHILVCDSQPGGGMSLWRGSGSQLARRDWPWQGPDLASLYSRVARAFSKGERPARQLELLGRVGRANDAGIPGVEMSNGRISVSDTVEVQVATARRRAEQTSIEALANLAARLQLGCCRILDDLIDAVAAAYGHGPLCLAGGLFYNTALTTAAARNASVSSCFVPPHPGNPGLALGAPLRLQERAVVQPASAHRLALLGPEYDAADIKLLLENCKLSYDYMDEGPLLERTAAMLARGRLVGWFQGRMEWGSRALGNRSILASPLSSYVLENLNTHLKGIASYRTYGVAVCEEDAPALFRDVIPSPFMEFEFSPLHAQQFHHVLPLGAARLRVQTVANEPVLLRRLLKAFGARSGLPALLNTSFNSSIEPIACTPRDAVRIFFSTGLDMLVLDRFVLTK